MRRSAISTLVEELYDIEVQLEPDATFEAARGMLDAALPGGGLLRERLAAHDADNRIPRERAIALAGELLGRLRMRTRARTSVVRNRAQDEAVGKRVGS